MGGPPPPVTRGCAAAVVQRLLLTWCCLARKILRVADRITFELGASRRERPTTAAFGQPPAVVKWLWRPPRPVGPRSRPDMYLPHRGKAGAADELPRDPSRVIGGSGMV